MNIDVANSKIFLISKDSSVCQILADFFSSKFIVSTFPNWDSCINKMDQRSKVIFIEMENGIEELIPFFEKTSDLRKTTSIILISNNNNITNFNLLSKYNIHSCLSKDELTSNRLYFLLKNISTLSDLQNKIEKLEENMSHDIVKNMVFSCSSMQRVAHLVNKASNTNITCYISGEQGTGKGVAAYLIHYFSNRKSSPYIYLKLSSIEEDDLEKELFGWEDANGQILKKGKIEVVNKGTLYLEDINLLSTSTQLKLLNLIKTGSFRRIGGTDLISIDIRFIVSTTGNLIDEMNAGNFSESLYYRLSGFPIIIPPLRNRGNDILLLAKQLMNQFSEKNNFEEKSLSKDAKKKLLTHSFPGNIRELKATLERAMVLSDTKTIFKEDIEFGTTSSEHLSFLDQDMTFEEYKSKIIHHFLKKYDNDIQVVSSKLDIGKSTIYRMLKSEKEKSHKNMSWFNMF